MSYNNSDCYMKFHSLLVFMIVLAGWWLANGGVYDCKAEYQHITTVLLHFLFIYVSR